MTKVKQGTESNTNQPTVGKIKILDKLTTGMSEKVVSGQFSFLFPNLKFGTWNLIPCSLFSKYKKLCNLIDYRALIC